MTGPVETTIQTGINATGISIRAEYYFWREHGLRYYNGTLHLNDTTFIYDSPGRRAYLVVSADGDDERAVSTMYSSSSIFIIWEAPEVPWSLIFGISGLGIGIIVFILVIRTKRLLDKRLNMKVPETKEDLATALDYLDMISSEQEPEHDDNI